MPSPSRPLTWLHLSDLHRCSTRDGGGGEIVLRRLREDLEALRDEHGLRPDLVFVTGDLAFGQTPEKPLAAQLREGWSWLEEVLALYGLDAEDVFLVPGNHDVDRGKVTKMAQDWLRSLAKSYGKEEIHRILQDGGHEWQDCMRRLKDFEAFLADHCPHLADDEGRCIYHVTREVAGLRVGIAGFNSAWSCGTKDDKGKLWLGEWQLDELASKLQDVDVRIALVHHPFNWLVASEDPALKARIATEFHVLLHGHEHQLWVETPQSDHLHVAAGAVLDRPDAELGYNVARFDLDEGTGEIWLRCLEHATKKWMGKVAPGRTDGRGVWRVPQPWEAGSAGVSPAPAREAALLVPKGRTKIAQGFNPGSSGSREDREDRDPRAEFREDLLSRVEQICRLREGESVRIERKDPEDGISYLSVQRRDGPIIRDYAVAAADDVTAATLDAFLRVLRRYQRLDPGGVSVLVCGAPASAELHRRSAGNGADRPPPGAPVDSAPAGVWAARGPLAARG